MLLIGLAVGVDYSMFYVKRQREERAAGRPVLEAIETAAATSGRSVLISGLTVLLAMSGMFLTGSKIFYGIGQATMLVVAVAVVASLTLLPALLALLGDRVDRGGLPFPGRTRRPAGQSRIWTAVLDRVLAHPALTAALAVGALVVLALPVLRLHTATPGASDLPQNTAALQTYNRIRSLVIPATAVLLNLLSVGAAYGVVVALFQWGWGQSLLGFTSVHSVASWLPLFLFVVLFGLSMDYHVFILSRIREATTAPGRPR